MKPERIISLIFGAIGTLMIIVAIVVFAVHKKKQNTWFETTAVISRIEYNDNNNLVFIDYEFDGIEYNDVRIYFYSSSFKVGKELDILVSPDSPYEISVKSEAILVSAIVGGIGLVFLIIAIPIFLASRKLAEQYERGFEPQRGMQHTTAMVNEVEYDYTRYNNGEAPYRIKCSITNPQSGEAKIFFSDYMFDDPALYYQPGDSIEVYADAFFGEYHVDANRIPPRRKSSEI